MFEEASLTYNRYLDLFSRMNHTICLLYFFRVLVSGITKVIKKKNFRSLKAGKNKTVQDRLKK
jgi:cytochrome b subunit of formate dehydrogenase